MLNSCRDKFLKNFSRIFGRTAKISPRLKNHNTCFDLCSLFCCKIKCCSLSLTIPIFYCYLSDDDDDDNARVIPIQLRVETYRNWFPVGILAAIPMLISVSICFFLGGFPGRSGNDDDDEIFNFEADLEEPLLSPQQSYDDLDTPRVGEGLLPDSFAVPMPTAVLVPLEEVPPVVEATPIDDLVTDVN